jgi:hypothetical protein
MITIFSAPKPFTNPHIDTIQRNAIRSWQLLGDNVEVLLIGDEAGMAEAAGELGVRVLPDVRRNDSGTPLVSSIFELARTQGTGELLAYVNADIILLPDFVKAAQQVAQQADRFLIVGQRWDLDVTEPLDTSDGWVERLQYRLHSEGRLHPRGGSDYFVFPRSCFETVPDFAIGRAGWDNWMFYEARQRGWRLVDATRAVEIIHQNHDYSHLPQGQPHYRLPETAENIRLAGGPRTIFNLLDVDTQLVSGQLRAPDLTWEKLWREVEIFPLVKLHSQALGQAAYSVFHPLKAYRELRARK